MLWKGHWRKLWWTLRAQPCSTHYRGKPTKRSKDQLGWIHGWKYAPFVLIINSLTRTLDAWTDAPLDNLGAVTDWYTHSLISENTYNVMVNACDFTNIGPLKADAYDPATCTQYQQIASQEMGNIDIYEMYLPFWILLSFFFSFSFSLIFKLLRCVLDCQLWTPIVEAPRCLRLQARSFRQRAHLRHGALRGWMVDKLPQPS